MTNLKSKQVRKAKSSNNEQWFECHKCDFIFTIYKSISPYCPNCSEENCGEIDAPAILAHENVKLWEDKELPFVQKVINGELTPSQCAILLDRSIASVEGKIRRMKRRGK